MFGNRNQPRAFDQPAANRVVNRLLTYGLVIFMIYAFYNTDFKTKKPTTANHGVTEINYTPINFGSYVKVTNLRTGEEETHEIKEDSGFTLMSPKVDKKNANPTPLYKLEFFPAKSCNIIVDGKPVLSFDKPIR